VEARVGERVLLGGCQRTGLGRIVRVDDVEQGREHRAEVHATPATMTRVEDTRCLVAHVGFVEVRRMVRVVGRGHVLIITESSPTAEW
jgi:hypothetical protein